MSLPDENVVEIWPEPKPLPEARPAVKEFRPSLLPEAVRPWVEDISERIQCPPDYAAVGVMVGLAAVIGRQVSIRPKAHDDWTVTPNLWGAVIGRPGIMKTPALQDALRPIRKLEADAIDAFQTAEYKYDADQWVRDAQDKALGDKLKTAVKTGNQQEISDLKAEKQDALKADSRPTCRRFETNDTSVEKLGELLAENPNGLLVFRDELTGWLRSLDREENSNSRAFFLESWNGTGGYTYDRIGRGTVRIEAACVSILGGIQPGPLTAYVQGAHKHGKGDDGLLQRFQLMVYPDEPKHWRNVDRLPDTEARNSAFSAFETLANLEISQEYLRFAPDAQEVFNAWLDELQRVKLSADQPEVIEAHLSKYRSLIPSIALISHLTDGYTGSVSKEAMLRAAAWGEYLESHARRVYALALGDNLATCALAEKILRKAVPDPFKPKDVYDKHWAHLDKGMTWQAVEGLEAIDWLRIEHLETGGRPSDICHVNPRVHDELD